MRRTSLLVLAVTILSGSGCVFNRVRNDQEILDNYGEVVGRVDATNWSGHSLIVVAARLPDKEDGLHIEITRLGVLGSPQEFRSFLRAGRYQIGAYEDLNDNQFMDDGERGVLSPEFRLFEGTTSEELTLLIEKPLGTKPAEGFELSNSPRPVVGEVLALDDERFGEAFGELGMWEPTEYILQRQPGLYMLEPYDPTRTPVVFVHGMTGYPQEFTTLIGTLDKTRFQAWVLLYPSGFRLNDVARFFDRAIDELEDRYTLERTCVVAHSMGGLVARGFLHFHTEGDRNQSVRGLVTIASPLAGVPSAGMGVKMAPEVVPSWYDLAPDSRYLNTIYERSLPESIEYHLLFTYDGDGSDDGTIPVMSQLRDEAQAEAEVVRGYHATHVGALESKSIAAQVNRALDRCAGATELAPIAPRIIDDQSGRPSKRDKDED